MKETCVVTGGAGLIGSNLINKLLISSYQVVCVDDLSTGRLANLKSHQNNPDFIFIKHDIVKNDPNSLKKYYQKARYIFHLASAASPNKNSLISYYSRPVETLLVNSYGTYKLLEYARVSGATFLFASTSEIYGDPLVHPQVETYWGNVNPQGSRSCYDEAKRFGEAITYTYFRKYNLDTRIVRIFNTYGPGMNREDGRVVSQFISQSLGGKPLTIYGRGKQTRSFCYVTDLVEGIYKLMFKYRKSGVVINLGNDHEVTVLEIAETVKSLTGTNSTIIYTKLPDDDPRRRRPDIKLARRLLDWKPEVNLHDGLHKTIEYFKSYKD